MALERREDRDIPKGQIGLMDHGVPGEEGSDGSGGVSLAFRDNRNRKFSRRVSLQREGD